MRPSFTPFTRAAIVSISFLISAGAAAASSWIPMFAWSFVGSAIAYVLLCALAIAQNVVGVADGFGCGLTHPVTVMMATSDVVKCRRIMLLPVSWCHVTVNWGR